MPALVLASGQPVWAASLAGGTTTVVLAAVMACAVILYMTRRR